MVTYRETILNKLKAARLEHGLNQDEFGKMLKVSRMTVIRWEKGEREPDLNTLALASSLFNIDITPNVSTSTPSIATEDTNSKEPKHELYTLLKNSNNEQLDFFLQLLLLIKHAPKE